MATALPPFKAHKGDKVEVRLDGGWWGAIVEEVGPEVHSVEFGGRGGPIEHGVPSMRLRAPPAAAGLERDHAMNVTQSTFSCQGGIAKSAPSPGERSVPSSGGVTFQVASRCNAAHQRLISVSSASH